jgi:hypothetical protein
MINFFLVLLVCIFFVEGITELLVKSKFFSSFREFFKRRQSENIYRFIHEVISCPYCTSVWVSLFIIILIYMVSFFTGFNFSFVGFAPLDLFLLVVLTHRLSNHLHNFCDKYLDKFYSAALGGGENDGE